MTLEGNRLASEQVDAPQAVFHMSEESQPGRAIPTAFRMVILGKNTPHYVSVYLDAEGLRYDSHDAGIAKARISLFKFDNSVEEFL